MLTLTFRRADDFHAHFRQGELMQRVVPFTASQFARAMVMPNTDPPIRWGEDVSRYRKSIVEALELHGLLQSFQPLMTFKIDPQTKPHEVSSAREAGAIAGKLYPDGVTTGSEGGVRDYRDLYLAFRKMEDLEMVLSIHGEDPDAFCLDREEAFVKTTLRDLVDNFPKLRIVVEHLSTAAAVHEVLMMPDTVAATITVHHLELTLNDVVGGLLKPHHFCKPLAKREEDRQALLRAATSGNPKFFFGSDTAPHPITKKECACGCAGVFSAPVALPLLAEIFERQHELDRLGPFVSEFGAKFYRLPLNQKAVTLVKKPWTVKQQFPDLVPYKLGQKIGWQIED